MVTFTGIRQIFHLLTLHVSVTAKAIKDSITAAANTLSDGELISFNVDEYETILSPDDVPF